MHINSMIDNKFSVMKFISRHKILFGCLIIAWIIGMIFTVLLISKSNHSKIKVQRMSHPLIHPLQHNRLPPASSFKMVKALRYCNPPNDITEGQEGKSPANSSLAFVAVIIRHGDRSPLRPIRNQSIINCGTTNSPLLQKYLKTLKHLRGSAKHLAPFTILPLHPAEKECTSAQMTLLGAHQHLMVGHVLQKSYEDHGFLGKNWTTGDIKLFSTIFSRTFQSAVAFLFGFLPTFNISNIQIVPSPSDRFCMSEYYCNKCPLADQLRSLVWKKRKRLLNSHPAVLHLLQRLSPIVKSQPNDPDILDPFEMFDSLMGYVCHGSHLPCIPGTNECVTFEHVRNLIAYIDWLGRQFVRDNTNAKAAMLNMQGFLNHLVSSIKNFINGKDPAKFILYSGHDITLEPLSAALGIDDGNMIPYASRIVFEVYNSTLNNKPKHVMKVLFNGKDVTKYTSFCKSFYKDSLKKSNLFEYGLCPFESFQKFVENFILTTGASSFKEACNSVHATSYPFDVRYSSYVDDSYKP